MPGAALSNVYCVVMLKMKGRMRSEEATGRQGDKDASKQLVISSYMFTLQRT